VTKPYDLSPGAKDDIQEIARHTVAHWGEEQCRTYIAALEAKATALAAGACPYRNMGALMPGLRAATSGKHYIFCLPRSDAPALILAVLHERMDILDRLKSRLGV